MFFAIFLLDKISALVALSGYKNVAIINLCVLKAVASCKSPDFYFFNPVNWILGV